MSRISKDVAYKTAKKMAGQRYDEAINKLQKQAGNIVREYLLTLIPEEVKECAKKYPGYFNKTSYYRFTGEYHRFGHKCQAVFEPIVEPIKVLDNTVEYNTAKEKVFTLLADCEELIDAKGTLLSRIESTMLELKTYKRLQEEFVECYNSIPSELFQKETKTPVPSIPISDIRKELLQ